MKGAQRRASPSARYVAGVRRVRIGESRFAVVAQGDLVVVFWGTVPTYSFRANDRLGRYVVAVDLVRFHELPVRAVGKALGLGERTLFRLLKRFEKGGVDALLGRKGRRMPTKIRDAEARRLLELKRRGASHRDAARRIGVSSSAVTAALRRLGWKGPQRQTNTRPQKAAREVGCAMSAVSEGASVDVPAVTVTDLARADHPGTERVGAVTESLPVSVTAPSLPVSADPDPTNRSGDRLMARLGLLADAAPMFAPGLVPRAGVLLAVPLLIASGIFGIAPKLYGSIGPAFYGLRTSILAFLVMALVRIKRTENLKEFAPVDLGRVLGLDRAPEMKTLRGKLHALAARGKGLELMRLLAKERVKERADDLAYLFIDGHVRVYNGGVKLPKTYVMQRRMAMPSTSDYWVNDQCGQPLLVITAEANEGMTKMLRPVLKEVRQVIGERRGTAVFDRGGWSPKLFKLLVDDHWDILTYRKGKTKKVSGRAFQEHSGTVDGRKVKYVLAEKQVRFLRGKLKLRQITVLGDDGYQTNILASNRDVPCVELVCRMFDRWRQENYFKYMKQEFALDAIVEYGDEAADPNRMVPNPQRKAIDKELSEARIDLAKLERTYGAAAFDNKEERRRTVRGFKIANAGAIGRPLREAREKVQSILERRKPIPSRVTISEALQEPPVRLRTETKRLSDTFKMVAYQTETALVNLLRPHYSRTEDEGRTLVASALQSAAELTINNEELCVTLAAQSSPHRTRAILAVCGELNKIRACFPGTNLRLRFEVAGAALPR
jgi:transposase